MTKVTLLFFAGCPNWRAVDRQLRELADKLGFEVAHREITSPEDAQRVGFGGSPTVLIDGRDPFPSDRLSGLSCRRYATDHGIQGAPPAGALRDALRRATARG